ncbi:phosphotransferase enzyme family protein [Haloferula sargassicola]|uniref:N-acetylhexosamine 1-kinase n=1 Tax=Haloferula sargassicola TaxID=490096 RepID=A0ABP9UPK3_9BACT
MQDLKAISRLFETRADFLTARPHGSGHINDTFCATYNQAGREIRLIHQRINSHVFRNPEALMENIDRVTRHSLARLVEAGHSEAHRRTLTLIPSCDGLPWARDAEGGYWRTFPFIEGALGYEEIENLRQAEEAAKAFGEFQKLAADLKGPRLHETIPDFHHTPKRLDALRAVLENAPKDRMERVGDDLEFAFSRAADARVITDLIASGDVPERVTHNDTKLSNVLLDEATSEGVCVIDLDTTMPGSVLYDFGDMVRTACPTTREDEVDLSVIDVRMDRFEALIRGYLAAASFLVPAEVEHLAFSGKLLALECGIRFLTDYLDGDHYFKTHRPGHNLDRCRAQFALVRAIEKRLPEMEDVVARTENK